MNNLQEDLKNINKNLNIIDINYLENEKKIFEKIKVKHVVNKTFFGTYKLKRNLQDLFIYSINNITLDETYILSDIIKKMIKIVIDNFKEETALIIIRITKPNNNFKIPRWHYDHSYFKNRTTPYYKFVTSIIGPSTMFYKDNIKKIKKIKKIRNEYYKTSDQSYEKELQIRKKINKFMKNKKKIKILNKHQAGIYLVGRKFVNSLDEYSVLHSEPNKNKDRIFISILPCKKEEITNIKTKWMNR